MSNLISTSTQTYLGKSIECAKFEIDTPIVWKLKNKLDIDSNYAISFVGKSAAAAQIEFYLGGKVVNVGLTTSFDRYQCIFEDITINDIEDTDIRISFPIGTFYIYNMQLEHGNIATDWRCAASEILTREKILNLISAASNYSGSYSVVEGYNTSATNAYTHAEGNSTLASGPYAHAEGYKTIAVGEASHAEGYNAAANEDYSHSAGYFTIANQIFQTVIGKYNSTLSDAAFIIGNGNASTARSNAMYVTTAGKIVANSFEGLNGCNASNNYAVAFGQNTTAVGSGSVAEGIETYVTFDGAYSHAEGGYTSASGAYSHTEGYGSSVSGGYSHSEGYFAHAAGDSSHAEGSYTTASGMASHTEGNHTFASTTGTHAEGKSTTASGEYSHAEGQDTIASGDCAHAEGIHVAASGRSSHAEGEFTSIGETTTAAHAEGYYTVISTSVAAHTEGYYTTASGNCAHAEGSRTVASAEGAHAGGLYTLASGAGSHSEGAGTTASGQYSHAEGQGSSASAINSHAEGEGTTASGSAAHSEGGGTRAIGHNSHAEGLGTTASGLVSHSAGEGTLANQDYQTVIGKYNSTVNNAAFIIGNGTASTARSNAIYVTTAGDINCVSVTQTSDERLKENINYLTTADIEILNLLEPKQFTLKQDKNKQIHYGFIAQDVEQKLNSLGYPTSAHSLINIDNNEQGYYSLNYIELIPLLVQKVQTLEEEIKALKINNK